MQRNSRTSSRVVLLQTSFKADCEAFCRKKYCFWIHENSYGNTSCVFIIVIIIIIIIIIINNNNNNNLLLTVRILHRKMLAYALQLFKILKIW